MSGWIFRTFNTRSPGVMLTLLKQLVYNTAEYNSVLWSPTDRDQIDQLESIQNNFLKRIQPNNNRLMDYWDRLELYKLYSLERRRGRYSIIYAWKVIHELYPNPGISFNTQNAAHISLPNLGIQVNVHQRDDITAHHPENPPKWLQHKSALKRCCDLYNCLPLQLRQLVPQDKVPSLDNFEESLDKWLTKIPDQATVPAGRFRPAKSNSIIHQMAYIKRMMK